VLVNKHMAEKVSSSLGLFVYVFSFICGDTSRFNGALESLRNAKAIYSKNATGLLVAVSFCN